MLIYDFFKYKRIKQIERASSYSVFYISNIKNKIIERLEKYLFGTMFLPQNSLRPKIRKVRALLGASVLWP